MDDAKRTLPRTILQQAEKHADKPYMVFTHEGAPVSFAALAANARAAGAQLSDDYGLEPGNVAAILLPNGTDFVSAWSACLFAGLVDIPINYEFKKATLLFALRTVEACVLITDESGLERILDEEVREYLDRLALVVLTKGTDLPEATWRLRAAGFTKAIASLDELCHSGRSNGVWETVDGMSLSSIRYTSGTTGVAKGIMFCHLHLLSRSATHNRTMTLGVDDRLYSPFPLYHGLAGIMGAIGTLQVGATLITTSRFSASRYWSEACQHKATLGHILFSLMPMVLQQPEHETDQQHNVRYLYSGWPHRKFEERFRTKLLQIYAQSELGVMAFRRAGQEEGSRNVGKPLPELEVQIVDCFDRPVAADQIGEIVIRPRVPQSLMLGYYNNLPATIRAFRNMWHHTGDSGYLAPNGELYFLGRIGDTIRRRGVNISSDQIDEEALRHPNVLECGTIGVPSPLGEDDIHLCVVWRQAPADQDRQVAELAEFLQARLPKQYVPKYIEPMDAIAKTQTGKIRKIDLKGRPNLGRTYDREMCVWLDPRPRESQVNSRHS
jgi:crotonobetaine/carnitine-CoA ligase